MIYIKAFNVAIFGINAGFALMDRNWHSAMGWGVAMMIQIASII